MPPKIKVTKENIIKAAVNVVREKGVEALNARALAAHMGCSTQPIFSNYISMDELRMDVIRSANDMYQAYLKEDIESNKYPKYKGSGMAYIRFAKEEKELFKLLFMRDRTGEDIQQDGESIKGIVSLIQEHTGLSKEKATQFHLQMWIYVHGIATMLATSYLPWEWDDISSMVTTAYEGMKKCYLSKEVS